MVFGGDEDDGLLLRFHHVPQQMKQQRRLVVHTQMEKRQLGEDSRESGSVTLHKGISSFFYCL